MQNISEFLRHAHTSSLSLEQTRSQLVHFVTKNYPDIEWADVIKGYSAASTNFLAEISDARLDVYDPSLFEEHFNAASRLLETCEERQKEIHRLETEAFNALLVLLAEDELSTDELSLVKLQVKAARAQIGAAMDATDADEDSAIRGHAIRSEFRRVRRLAHHTVGHSLNYKERLARLHNLQKLDLQSLYERYHAARLGLLAATGLELDALPSWKESDANHFDELTVWARKGVRRFERHQKRERRVTRTLRLGRNMLFSGGIAGLREMILVDTPPKEFPISFEVARTDLDVGADDVGVRLLGIGVSVELSTAPNLNGLFEEAYKVADRDEDRARFGHLESYQSNLRHQVMFSGKVQVPAQEVIIDGRSRRWFRESLDLTSDIRAWDGAPASSRPFNRAAQITNINPIGSWNLELVNEYESPGRLGEKLSSLRGTEAYRYLNFSDIVVSFHLAVVRTS
jgi:hypothetical protein